MKSLVNKSILLEVSQRELEMIRTACEMTKSYWLERAENTLEVDQVMKEVRLTIADNYERLACEANEILNNLPF